jgi:multiple sugar transport system ATP-binding protein
MRVEIAQLHNDLGNTMIYVTHDQVEAMTMADKIVVLQAGIIEQVGAPLDLYNNPRNRFVAGFIGSPKMNFLDARIEAIDGTGAEVVAGTTRIALPRAISGGKVGDKVTFGVRPEHVTVAEGSGVRLAELKVTLVEQLGGATMLYARTADGQALTIALNGQSGIGIGETITAYVDPARYHVFSEAGEAI